MSRFARLAFTDTVRRVQQQEGTRPRDRGELGSAVGLAPDPLGERERDFIGQRDGFYIATVGETGWPYVQFRGGPAGFVHVLDEYTLGYADVRGNREYITNGNLRTDGRVALFFMDYAGRERLKLFGRAETRRPEDDPELTDSVCRVRTTGRVERVPLIRVEGFDWNCPKHIPHRYTGGELAPVRERLSRLESENAELRSRLRALGEDPDELRREERSDD